MLPKTPVTNINTYITVRGITVRRGKCFGPNVRNKYCSKVKLKVTLSSTINSVALLTLKSLVILLPGKQSFEIT